ncbi:MAG: hypothetical protein QM817_08725 [Archangium sp.]
MLGVAVSLMLCANPYLTEARKHFDTLEFDAATRSFAVAVEQSDLSAEERRIAFDLWAQALLALNRRDEAEKVYVRWLKSDPWAPPPNAAPKVVDAFLRARQIAWPKPSVKWTRVDDGSSGTVRVELFDPWSLASRVRWLEALESGLTERPTPPLEAHVLTVQPTPGAKRLLFDALDAQDVLLSHFEIALAVGAATTRAPTVTTAPTTPSVKWAPIVILAASAIAAGFGAAFLGLGYRAPPTLTAASDINAWNRSANTQVGLGWSLLGVGVAGAGTGAALFAF